MKALFITPEYLKSVSIIDENVDHKILTIAIIKAQEYHIRRKLGSALYNKYVTDIDTSGSAGVIGVYRTLMNNYITPALVEWTLYEAALWLLYKYRNKAISTQNSDNSQPVDLTIVQGLRDEHKNAAEMYTELLIKYLLDNMASYPEYANNPNMSDVQSETDNYESSIWLGGSKRLCYRDRTEDLG